MIKVIIDSRYYRERFDDWLAGGKVEYNRKTYYWYGQDSNYGFGWEIEPITEIDWSVFDENEIDELVRIIEICLYKYKAEYVI